ncbi:MAG: flagellar motor protein MotB [Anaerolineaceae bacterium]
MAHREEEEAESGGSERWLVSYSDFITLLMCIFVVLYSMGQTDVEKYKQLADSLKSAFSFGGPVEVIDSRINEAGGSIENGQAKPIVVPGIPSEPPKSEEVANELTQMLAINNLGNEVSVQTNIEGVLISLSEKLVFVPGTARLPSDVYPVLDIIVEMLKPIENSIRLVGYTDDQPPQDPRYANNMELSVARAMVVTDYLIKKGISPERIIVSGRGQYHPIFQNDTPAHRALNGRVEIVIIYNVESSVIGIDTINIAP